MDVSVIIVNYNTRQLLYNCISSIIKHTFDIEYEIIVVDNASIDGSQEMVRDFFPFVHLVESETNLGFGKANNLGFDYSSGRNIFLLNSDTLLIENSIKILSEVLDSDTSIGATGGLLINSNNQQVHSYGIFPSIKHKLQGKDFVIRNINFKENRSVDYITGADLMISRSTWLTLGGFDPNFFLYYEETDLQKRMEKMGFKRILVPKTRIIHMEGESTKVNSDRSSKNEWKSLIMFNSMVYYLKKHSSSISFMLFKNLLMAKYMYFVKRKSKNKTLYNDFINCLNNY